MQTKRRFADGRERKQALGSEAIRQEVDRPVSVYYSIHFSGSINRNGWVCYSESLVDWKITVYCSLEQETDRIGGQKLGVYSEAWSKQWERSGNIEQTLLQWAEIWRAGVGGGRMKWRERKESDEKRVVYGGNREESINSSLVSQPVVASLRTLQRRLWLRYGDQPNRLLGNCCFNEITHHVISPLSSPLGNHGSSV